MLELSHIAGRHSKEQGVAHIETRGDKGMDNGGGCLLSKELSHGVKPGESRTRNEQLIMQDLDVEEGPVINSIKGIKVILL